MKKTYREAALSGAAEYRSKPAPLMLGIESSCDETAASVVRNGREVLSASVHTQIPVHRLYGGVVPEIASRSHTERIGAVVRDALEKADEAFWELIRQPWFLRFRPDSFRCLNGQT